MTTEYTASGFVLQTETGKIINHYGVLFDANKPTTGVYSNHDIEWLQDELYYGSGIDLDWQEHVSECHTTDNDGNEICDSREFGGEIVPVDLCDWESYDSTWIIGDWQKDDDGKYEPDHNGKHGDSAIVRSDVTQVVWSRWVTRGELCSPCYPGQVSVERDGQGSFLAYALPPDLLGQDD